MCCVYVRRARVPFAMKLNDEMKNHITDIESVVCVCVVPIWLKLFAFVLLRSLLIHRTGFLYLFRWTYIGAFVFFYYKSIGLFGSYRCQWIRYSILKRAQHETHPTRDTKQNEQQRIEASHYTTNEIHLECEWTFIWAYIKPINGLQWKWKTKNPIQQQQQPSTAKWSKRQTLHCYIIVYRENDPNRILYYCNVVSVPLLLALAGCCLLIESEELSI